MHASCRSCVWESVWEALAPASSCQLTCPWSGRLSLPAPQVQHELECSACGHTSRVVEEYMHLSLELPEPQVGGAGRGVAY